jgi:hypothetical protein
MRRNAGLRQRTSALLGAVLCALRVIGEEAKAHLRLDWAAALIAAIYLTAFLPIIPRATENAQMLNCCIDDEVPLTQQLDGMLAMPFGNVVNFFHWPSRGPALPEYWGGFNYGGGAFFQYGGAYEGLAFLAYAPLRLAGVPPFPMAPILLRAISTVMGLVALLITYNFGRRHVSRLAGIIAAMLLLTNGGFIYYATIIHPDALQFALAMLTLAIAARHAQAGGWDSLTAMGMTTGLVHGAKMGGPWLVPMVALAAAVGLRHQRPELRVAGFLQQLVARGVVAGAAALLCFLISTPYAVLTPEYASQVKQILAIVGSSSITPVDWLTWLDDLWKDVGPFILLLAAAGALLVILQALRGKARWPLILALVLGITQFVWYAGNGHLWVILFYLLCLFAAIGLFAGSFIEAIRQALQRIPAGRMLGAGVAAVILIVIGSRWWQPASFALAGRLTDDLTVVEIGRWAAAGNIPPDARILWDDVAVFDPAKFPNARRYGGLLTYNELYAKQPDYVVLSAAEYGAPYFAELIRTQHYTMQKEGPVSVRLYQDLLPTDRPGWTRVPGIEFVRDFVPDAEGTRDCVSTSQSRTTYRPWLGSDGPDIAAGLASAMVGGGAAGAWLAQWVSVQLQSVNLFGRLVDAAGGRLCVRIGPTLKLYHIHRPGSEDGFEQPFASTTNGVTSPAAAFDGDAKSYWVPLRSAAMDSFIGFDFGRAAEKRVARVEIDWQSVTLTAPIVEVQYADYGRDWISAGLFTTAIAVDAAPSTRFNLPPDIGEHRLWRVVMRALPPSGSVGVGEVRFLEPE